MNNNDNGLAIKKRAEVAAFIGLAGSIAERAGQPFAGHAPQCLSRLQAIAGAGQLLDDSVPPEQRGLYDTKTAKTVKKLTAMMELYVGDEWDNPVEVLEWSSFYAGAGAAHCAIAGRLATDTDTANQLHQLEADFRQLLDDVIHRLAR